MANKGGDRLKTLWGELHYLTRKEATKRPIGANSGNPVAAAFFFVMEVGKTYNKLGDKIFNNKVSNDIHI